MRKKTSAILILSVMFLCGLAVPATAFYFDLQYFETDKLVYEVGETIEMAASLIADFSSEGWCYVSFAVVTNQGPAFADEYFISPLPSPRIVNSSYVILPEDISPGTNGSQAFVSFVVEVFDTISQGAEDSVEVNIVRGQLTVIPLTSLIIHPDAETSISLKVSSIHNNDIVLANEDVNVKIKNPNSMTILDENMTTNGNGTFSIDWNSSMDLPGDYDLTVSGFGNEDFLDFSKTLQIKIIPAAANLTVLVAPESVQCQSPDKSHFESAEIVVRHLSEDQTPIDDSTVSWNATFGNGVLTSFGNGNYSASIDFRIAFGSYVINITATNPRFETVYKEIVVEALRNRLHFSPAQDTLSVIQGNSTILEFMLSEDFDWGNKITIQFSDFYDEILIELNVTPGLAASLLLTAWYNLTIGSHIIHLNINNDYYELPDNTTTIQLNILGTLRANTTILSAFYTGSLELNLDVFDINNTPVTIISISAYIDNEVSPLFTMEQVDTTQILSIELPSRINPGFHTLCLEISVPLYITISKTINVSIWARTNITIIIGSHSERQQLDFKNTTLSLRNHQWLTISSISLGSIIRPPPILPSETTSTESLTTRETSLSN